MEPDFFFNLLEIIHPNDSTKLNKYQTNQQLRQFIHLQYSLHLSPDPKHSQYFLVQSVFLQLQPFILEFLCPKGTKARTITSSIALALISLNY